jgi:hypothetical protein
MFIKEPFDKRSEQTSWFAGPVKPVGFTGFIKTLPLLGVFILLLAC